jgi:acyl-CoA synthetase (NDP forming)
MIGRFDCRSCREQIIYRNLRRTRGEHVYLVNLRGCDRADCPFTAVPGSRCYPDLAALPDEVDLLISSLPLAETTALVDDCRAAGVKNLIIWLGNREGFIPNARRLVDAGNSIFFSIEEATSAYAYTMRYYEKLAKVVVPPRFDRTFTYDRDRAGELIRGALDAGREILSEREAKELLPCYRLPVSPTYGVKTFNEASRVAERLGYPVVLKSDRRDDDCPYKSDRWWDRITTSTSSPLLSATTGGIPAPAVC